MKRFGKIAEIGKGRNLLADPRSDGAPAHLKPFAIETMERHRGLVGWVITLCCKPQLALFALDESHDGVLAGAVCTCAADMISLAYDQLFIELIEGRHHNNSRFGISKIGVAVAKFTAIKRNVPVLR